MTEMTHCSQCGAALSDVSASSDLCAKCLVRFALYDSDALAGAGDTSRRDEVAESSAERIGHYRLLQKLGQGGMGVVYRAQQEVPVQRTVALKLIKAGMDTERVIARFETERQALAMMDHPAIARVYDAGTTERGRPYFVMEYVQGEPITSYCDRQRMSTRARLELYARVCEGVQHAHQKGIIHRDIKPSNVLITLQDGEPVPKIIDFGVAKATQARLTERSLFTELGAIVGTPEYMSPEQAEMTGLDVDTRTDVYSLGVLLYELLVGALPLEPVELRRAGFEEICRRIREEEPSKPSAMLITLGDSSVELAKHRQTNPGTLARELRGDLDWITMKALEKDRVRRYGSPAELAADIQRHLTHEPVTAGPPNAGYRFRKFVRRHRVGATAAAVVLLALILGVAGTTYGLIRAGQAEGVARREAATAERVSEFLVDLFDVSDPGESPGEIVTAREVLDTGVDKIAHELSEDPRMRAKILRTLGRVYMNLGLLGDAEPLLEDARALEQGLGLSDASLTTTKLAWLRLQLGRYDEAERLYRLALDARLRELGEEHPDTAHVMDALGNLYRIEGRLDEAETLLEQAREIHLRVRGEDHPETLHSMGNLSVVYQDQGRLDDATALLRETLEGFRRVVGEDHYNTLTVQRLLGGCLQRSGQYEEAETVLQDAIKTQRRVLGKDHPRLMETVRELAMLYRAWGRYGEAETLFLEAIAGTRRVRGDDHPYTISFLSSLGETYRLWGRLADAESTLIEAREQGGRALGDHSDVGAATRYLALVRRAQNRLDDAADLLIDAIRIFRHADGESADLMRRSLVDLARVKALQGERERALERLRDAVSQGYKDAGLAEDPAFALLREDAEFQALAAKANPAVPEP